MRDTVSVANPAKGGGIALVGAMIVAATAFLAGCRAAPSAVPISPATPDIDFEIARASAVRQPLLLLVTESGLSPADDAARSLFQSLAARGNFDRAIPVVLDLSASRNRATATRFHATNSPLLFCLSPRGLIVTRDQPPLTKNIILRRLDEVAREAPELDARLALLEAAAEKTRDSAAELALANFLFAQRNAREAIPRFKAVARSEAADPALRLRAWVDLVRAHFWIAEPEKGRHEAESLIATLGPKTPEARAGGELVLGLQDATGKRFALARREFEEAIAAAPQSAYAKQAAQALAELPGKGR
jgi:hypothetical protein